MLKIKIKYHNKNIEKVAEIPNGDWLDLRAAETVTMKAGEFKTISLGVSMKLPEGYEAHIVPRSSTFKKWGVLQVNGIGVVDNQYCGENDIWRFPALAMRDTVIEAGDRICQFRIMKKMEKAEFIEVEHMEDADRGGFGSTGTKYPPSIQMEEDRDLLTQVLSSFSCTQDEDIESFLHKRASEQVYLLEFFYDINNAFRKIVVFLRCLWYTNNGVIEMCYGGRKCLPKSHLTISSLSKIKSALT